jgi:predicted acylesterase/phospholipase RssA
MGNSVRIMLALGSVGVRGIVHIGVSKVKVLERESIPIDLIVGGSIGALIRAVMANCSVPGFMPAVQWDEMMLIDGAVVGAVPADLEKAWRADGIIGVRIGSCLGGSCTIEAGIDAINHAIKIMEL